VCFWAKGGPVRPEASSQQLEAVSLAECRVLTAECFPGRRQPDFNRGKRQFNRGKSGFNRGKRQFNRGKSGFNRGKRQFNGGK